MKSAILACLLALSTAPALADDIRSFAEIREGDVVTLRAGYAFDEIHSDIGRSHTFGRYCYSRIFYAPKGFWQNFEYGLLGPGDPGPISFEKETHWKVVHKDGRAFAAESLDDAAKPQILIRCQGTVHLNGTLLPTDFGKDVKVPVSDALEEMESDGVRVAR